MPERVESALPTAPLTRHSNLRAYLAGGGATATLIAGAVVVFLGAAAFVAFNGLPFGADDARTTRVALGNDAPRAAATAAAPGVAAVAAAPATPSAAATAELAAALPPGVGAPAPGDPGGPGNAGDDFVGGGPIPVPPGPGPGPEEEPRGILSNTVVRVEETGANAGLQLPLSKLTGSLTAGVDNTVNNTVNTVGGAIGQPNLGDRTSATVNGVTDSLLGSKR